MVSADSKTIHTRSASTIAMYPTKKRYPLVRGDPDNLAAAIESYLEKVTPGQTRFYCKAMSEKSKERYVKNGGNENHALMPNIPLGKTKIKELFDDGAKILGLSKPNEFFAHSLCAMFITNLANDPHVSTKEAQISARHNNLNSTTNYQTRDGLSETNKYVALGIVPAEGIEKTATRTAAAAAPSSFEPGELQFFFL